MMVIELGSGNVQFSFNANRRKFHCNLLPQPFRPGETIPDEVIKQGIRALTIDVVDIRSLNVLLEALITFREQITIAHLVEAVPKRSDQQINIDPGFMRTLNNEIRSELNTDIPKENVRQYKGQLYYLAGLCRVKNKATDNWENAIRYYKISSRKKLGRTEHFIDKELEFIRDELDFNEKFLPASLKGD